MDNEKQDKIFAIGDKVAHACEILSKAFTIFCVVFLAVKIIKWMWYL